MTDQPVTAGVRRRGGRLEPIIVTALYDSAESVDAVLRGLHEAGVPRDLVEVVVSREAAERFYRRRARPPGREVFRYAAIGGIVGLILSSALSLVILALPGVAPPGGTAMVQLLGPNVGTVGGAALGALFGAFRRRRPSRRHARAAEAAKAILLTVRTRAEDEVPALEQLLAASGGREVRVES